MTIDEESSKWMVGPYLVLMADDHSICSINVKNHLVSMISSVDSLYPFVHVHYCIHCKEFSITIWCKAFGTKAFLVVFLFFFLFWGVTMKPLFFALKHSCH